MSGGFSQGVEDSSINLPPLPLSNSKAARPGTPAGIALTSTATMQWRL